MLTTLFTLAVPVAAAQANAQWTGASSSAYWSVAANWTGTTPPTTSSAVGTLSFPLLGTCGTCYTSNNNLTGISATGVVFGNTTKAYHILGNRFTVGSGGITATEGGNIGETINAPIALGASQTWVAGSSTNGYNSLTFLGGVTGPTTDALTISTPKGDVYMDSDLEVGPLTSRGPGTLHIGGSPTANAPGSLNGTDGRAVSITGGTLIPNLGSKSGSLTMTNSTLLLGTNSKNNGTTSLQVSGTASLASTTTTKTFINDNGSTPVTDFSQLSATGNITVGGQLVVGQGGQGSNNGPCVTLKAGDVATLVKTSGTLSGHYANAPNGTTLTMASSCQSTRPKVQIHYTSNSVTATVV